MILSMTGHGRASESIPGKTLTVELKSVNSRYLDITCKMPKIYIRFEERIKQLIREYAGRGKIELFISFDNFTEDDDQQIALNKGYLKNYLECLYAMRDEFGLRDDITVSSVAANRDVFVITKADEEEDEVIWSRLEPVLRSALSVFYEMKQIEGEKMKADLLEKLSNLEAIIEKIKERLPAVVEAYRERLTAKIRESLENLVSQDIEIAESRIITEVAIFSDKVAVDEETVRLASHFSLFREILCGDNSKDKNQVGRKLDFLLQEINREINTTGSKVTDAAVASLVVDAKSEAEKIREQVQNIE
ncbi:MAG: YicC family protein [Ruminococcaceae bacterium]|nr:YicC family protein [Oscillospiraceae bacterium]